MPAELLQQLLLEELQPEAVAAAAELRGGGSCLQALRLGAQLVVLSASGQAGQAVTLTVLQATGGDDGGGCGGAAAVGSQAQPVQGAAAVTAVRAAMVSVGAPILQLAAKVHTLWQPPQPPNDAAGGHGSTAQPGPSPASTQCEPGEGPSQADEEEGPSQRRRKRRRHRGAPLPADFDDSGGDEGEEGGARHQRQQPRQNEQEQEEQHQRQQQPGWVPPGRPVLLLARCTQAVHLLVAQQAVAGDGASWQLRMTVQLPCPCRPAHVAWNAALAEAAIVCEDGSVLLAAVGPYCQLFGVPASGPTSGAAALLREAEAVGGKGSGQAPATLQPRLVARAEQLHGSCAARGRLLCAYGAHPRQLHIACGQQLLRLHLPPQGPAPADAATQLLQLPPGECFTAIATAAGSSGVPARVTDAGQLLGLATTMRMLLLDARSPYAPLLAWEHGVSQDPPTALALHAAHTAGSASGVPGMGGPWGAAPAAGAGQPGGAPTQPSQRWQYPSQMFDGPSQQLFSQLGPSQQLGAHPWLASQLGAATQASQAAGWGALFGSPEQGGSGAGVDGGSVSSEAHAGGVLSPALGHAVVSCAFALHTLGTVA